MDHNCVIRPNSGNGPEPETKLSLQENPLYFPSMGMGQLDICRGSSQMYGMPRPVLSRLTLSHCLLYQRKQWRLSRRSLLQGGRLGGGQGVLRQDLYLLITLCTMVTRSLVYEQEHPNEPEVIKGRPIAWNENN